MKKFVVFLTLVAMLVLFSAGSVFAMDEANSTEDKNPGGGGAVSSGNSLSPNMVVSKFSVGGDSVTAGRNFTLTYTLLNTNKSLSIQNIMVKINGGDVFSLAKDADTYYADNIKARGAIEHSSTFVSSVETKPGSYPVKISVTYEYYDGGTKYQGSSELSVSVPVGQDDRVVINKASIGSDEEPVILGEEYGVEYDFLNAGFSKMLNTQLFLYDDETQNLVSSAYLGTVNPSTQMTGSSYIYATFGSTGTKKMRMVISYEDQQLNITTVDKEFTVNVEDVPPPISEEPVQSQGGFLIWGSIAVVVIVVAAIVLVVVKRRKKKKAQNNEALWDDEDELDVTNTEASETAAIEVVDKAGSEKSKGEKNEDN